MPWHNRPRRSQTVLARPPELVPGWTNRPLPEPGSKGKLAEPWKDSFATFATLPSICDCPLSSHPTGHYALDAYNGVTTSLSDESRPRRHVLLHRRRRRHRQIDADGTALPMAPRAGPRGGGLPRPGQHAAGRGRPRAAARPPRPARSTAAAKCCSTWPPGRRWSKR